MSQPVAGIVRRACFWQVPGEVAYLLAGCDAVCHRLGPCSMRRGRVNQPFQDALEKWEMEKWGKLGENGGKWGEMGLVLVLVSRQSQQADHRQPRRPAHTRRGKMGGNGGKWGEMWKNAVEVGIPHTITIKILWTLSTSGRKMAKNRGVMREKWEKNATRYPCSPIPFSPFFRRPQTFPLIPFTKLSIWFPDGKMGEIESIHGYPKIRVPRRLASRLTKSMSHRAAAD